MRSIAAALAVTGLLIGAVGHAQAKPVSQSRQEVCRWGSQVAQAAQQSRFEGKTLPSVRQRLHKRQYSQPWMKRMALGITDQTYASGSRATPRAVRDSYYQDCLKHQMARR